MKFHHIGIFVASIETGLHHLSNIFPITISGQVIEDPTIKVRIQFIRDPSGLLYELVAPLGCESPVEQSLVKKRNILNHVAYEVENIEQEIHNMRNKNLFPIMSPTPAVAFNNQQVCFLLSPLGFIVELIESRK